MLSAEMLSKKYGNKRVLENVSFTVNKGEFVSIIGPSGEGKSTIARILCGTVKADSGSVRYKGQILSFDKHDSDIRRTIQLIPQQPFASLDPMQTIGKAISEQLLFHKLCRDRDEAKKRACELLEQVLLPAVLYDRRPGELSGGQAQRVLIARSLTVSPSLLIADEATSMLDVSSQAQVLKIFRQLRTETGLSILLISHDKTLVESASDRIYHLSEGKMKEIENIMED